MNPTVMENQEIKKRQSRKTWTIMMNEVPVFGSNNESWVLRHWARYCAFVRKNGGCAQLISGRSMVIDECRKGVCLA